MSLSREQAAQALGMKVREIHAIEAVDGGHVITTHDRRRTGVDQNRRIVEFTPVDRAPAGENVLALTAEPNDPGTADGEVPEGTTDAVLAWVDGDPQRAAAALTAENLRDRPRSTLVEALARLTEA